MKELFFYPFFNAWVVAVASLLIFLFFQKWSWPKWKEAVRLGGGAAILGFVSALLMDQSLVISKPLWGIMVGALAIFLFGVADDRFNFSWKIQLFFQLILAVGVYFWGIKVQYVSNPLGGVIFLQQGGFFWGSLIFGIGWFLVIINALNWLDGVDGLSGGVSLLSSLAIFFIALFPEVNQPPTAIIAMALAGGIAGFLMFNFPRSRMIAGTSGSFFFGFSLAALAIFSGTKIATALLALSLPLVDFFLVIFDRLKRKKSVFKGDSCHLHYQLRKIGWSDKKIVCFYYLITAILFFIAINTRKMDKVFSLVLAGALLVTIIVWINRKAAQLE